MGPVNNRAGGGRGSSPLMMSFEDMFKARATPAQRMYASAPGTGQAMSPMAQAMGTDRKVAQADRSLSGMRARLFAEGGKVGISPGGLKTMKDALARANDRDRERAIQTLRASRAAIVQNAPDEEAPAMRLLQEFVRRPASPALPSAPVPRSAAAMADGGAVEMRDQNPSILYQQYVQLLDALEDPATPGAQQSEIIAKLAQLEEALESMGVNLTWDPQQAEGSGEPP